MSHRGISGKNALNKNVRVRVDGDNGLKVSQSHVTQDGGTVSGTKGLKSYGFGLDENANLMRPIKVDNIGKQIVDSPANSDLCLRLDAIKDHGKAKKQYNGQTLLGSTTSLSVYADTIPVPQSDPDGRSGWLHTKSSANTDKFNYYFYSEGNTPVTLADLTGLNAQISVDQYTSGLSLPFFVVYTKMTGVGDMGSFYHSKITYGLSAGEKILVGEDIEMWAINKNTIYDKRRHVEFNVKGVEGDGLSTEEIYTISLHSDSTSPINTQILVKDVGFTLYTGTNQIERKSELKSM